jgi:carbonic anhydrase
VAAKLSAGKLKLHGWVYKIETGEVFAYEPEEAQFVPVADAQGGPLSRHKHLASSMAI